MGYERGERCGVSERVYIIIKKKKNDMIQNIRKVIWLHRKRSASKLVDKESYARRVVIANIIYFTLKTRIKEKKI